MGKKDFYKIKWASGGETEEIYSNKILAKNVLLNSPFKGRIVKTTLEENPTGLRSYTTINGKKIQLSRNLVWIGNPVSNPKGYVYHKRYVRAINESERKRIMIKTKTGWKIKPTSVKKQSWGDDLKFSYQTKDAFSRMSDIHPMKPSKFKKPVKVRSHKKKGTKGVRKHKRRKPLGRRKSLRN